MRYNQIDTLPALRIATDYPDRLTADARWAEVPWRADALGIDCVLAWREGSITALAAKGVPLVVAIDAETPAALVDSTAHHVFADDPADVVAMILARAAARPTAGWRERADDPAIISALSLEAARIAEALARLAAEARSPGQPARVDSTLVRKLIRLRRDRDRYFPAEIFADPAWDMLLDLVAARLEGRRVSVSSLCIAASVPTTTALRWIRSLAEAGIFARVTDVADARRTWIDLSDTAHGAMMAWLGRFAEQFSPV
ncbi:hypothetical protein GCM10007973_17230 [Polymorphobacter multimanifer]|uniref:HTH marR-type domain-containing protein n=1 Tax=Polymorphobacter multimanifer TaxID=1070431 RepID=A0A841L0H8_9SPHN|nr:hypothetical protein [Polymorphobacter multimanifer]MBB6226329.1 hypothetical protein [Polymorphobacter multimanifer]GGI81273.1 hypothetical protein GCM10007973_17230 [Polymorphobacter multimanifer]